MKKMHKSVWDKIRTIAWETVFQITLRNCSKEVGGTVSVTDDCSEGGVGNVQSSTHVGEAHCQSQGTLCLINNFSDFLDMRYNN